MKGIKHKGVRKPEENLCYVVITENLLKTISKWEQIGTEWIPESRSFSLL